MKCNQCDTQVNAKSKFCPSCGAKVFSSAQAKKPEEVTLDWLQGIAKQLKYEIVPPEDGTNFFIGQSEEYSNVGITLNQDIGMITVMSLYTLKKIGWGERKEMLSTLNKANGMGSVCSYFIGENSNSLTIYSYLLLTARLSEQDMVSFLEKFNAEALPTLMGSGLIKFCE